KEQRKRKRRPRKQRRRQQRQKQPPSLKKLRQKRKRQQRKQLRRKQLHPRRSQHRRKNNFIDFLTRLPRIDQGSYYIFEAVWIPWNTTRKLINFQDIFCRLILRSRIGNRWNPILKNCLKERLVPVRSWSNGSKM